MKIDFKTLIILSSLIFNLQAQVLAGDSVGLSISCTIPAIPGVNAPLNEKTDVEPLSEETKTQTTPLNQENQEEEPVFIEEIQLAQDASAAFTKIIYSR